MQRTLMGALHSGTIITLVDACRERLPLRLMPHVLEGAVGGAGLHMRRVYSGSRSMLSHVLCFLYVQMHPPLW